MKSVFHLFHHILLTLGLQTHMHTHILLRVYGIIPAFAREAKNHEKASHASQSAGKDLDLGSEYKEPLVCNIQYE
jgi:hypothetical protein